MSLKELSSFSKFATIVGAIVSSAAVVVLMFAFDDRYMHDAVAGQVHAGQYLRIQRGDLEGQIDLTKLRIEYLRSKRPLSLDEQSELRYLEGRLASLEGQLAQVKKEEDATHAK